MIARLIKFLLLLVVLAGLAFVGFAYLGDLSPDVSAQKETVTIEID
jgi:hypothetical protein